jgi:hypothetical protein
MALLGRGVLVIWHGMTAEGDEEMIRWHNREHIAERVGVPGFLRGRRYAHSARPREYLDLYETESVETIRSEPYLARLNNPTPWTQRVLPHFRDTVRIGCRVLTSSGRGQGGGLLTLRLHPRTGGEAMLQETLTGQGLAFVRQLAEVVGVHVVETVAETTRIRTAEGKLKGGEVAEAEKPCPFVLLVEASDPRIAEALAAGPLHPERLAAHGVAPGAVADTYRLQISMERE